jgi:hypothetical protein
MNKGRRAFVRYSDVVKGRVRVLSPQSIKDCPGLSSRGPRVVGFVFGLPSFWVSEG